MKIDEKIEERVREALAACVGEDLRRFDAALDGLTGTQGPVAWSYALYAAGTVLNTILPSGVTEKDLDEISQEAIDALPWYDLGGSDQVKALLRSAAAGDPTLRSVDPDKAVVMTFVLASYLLQAYRPDGQEWWDYLDAIWNAAEVS